MIIKKIQKNQKELITLGVFILPLLIILGLKFNQQLEEKSWQEFSHDKLKYETVPTCLEDINKAAKASTVNLSNYFLNKGITCLDNIPFSLKDDFNYQNIVSISENLDHRNHQELKKDLEQISQNWEKKLYQHSTISFAGYLLLYSVLLFLAYIFVVVWWDDKEDYIKDHKLIETIEKKSK